MEEMKELEEWKTQEEQRNEIRTKKGRKKKDIRGGFHLNNWIEKEEEEEEICFEVAPIIFLNSLIIHYPIYFPIIKEGKIMK